MKGIAAITDLGKDGKVKYKTKQHNTITTAHLEKLKQAIANQVYDRTTPSSTSPPPSKRRRGTL